MSLTAPQQAAMEKQAVRLAYFAQFDFVSGIVRVCNFGQTVTWGGFDWTGLGGLGSISPVEESAGRESSALKFTLNVAQASFKALALGSVDDYRGKAAKLYICPLTEQYQLIDTPAICWRGTMDLMTVGFDGENGQIVLQCETSANGLRRRPTLRMNAAQQKARYPTDTGFDLQGDLIARPQLWLSKLFQHA
jgi:hypothetical protein